MAKVLVTIDPKQGTCKYEVQGMIGGGCEELTKALMQSNETIEQQFTEEYCVPDHLPDYLTEEASGHAEALEESTGGGDGNE